MDQSTNQPSSNNVQHTFFLMKLFSSSYPEGTKGLSQKASGQSPYCDTTQGLNCVMPGSCITGHKRQKLVLGVSQIRKAIANRSTSSLSGCTGTPPPTPNPPTHTTNCSVKSYWKPLPQTGCILCLAMLFTKLLHLRNFVRFNREDVQKLLASDFLQPRYKHSMNICNSVHRFLSHMEFCAKNKQLYEDAIAINVFNEYFFKDKMHSMYKGETARSKIKNSSDAQLLEGFPSPDEIKAAIKRAILYIEVIANYLEQEDAELDWAWPRFTTMLLIGIIFFITIAGIHYTLQCSMGWLNY
jgi:hypothetical protein